MTREIKKTSRRYLFRYLDFHSIATKDFNRISVALEVEANAPFAVSAALSCLLEAIVDALPISALGHIKAMADYGSGKLYASSTISPPGVSFTPANALPSPSLRASIALTCILGGVAGEGLVRAVDAGLAALTRSGFKVRKETNVG